MVINMNEITVKLMHRKFETPLVLSPENPKLLIVENPHEFYELVSELKRQFGGEEGDFLEVGGGNLTGDKKWELIDNPFDFGGDSKKTTSLLYKKLESTASDGELLIVENALRAKLSEYFYELFDRIDMPLSFDEVCLSDILKIGKIRFADRDDGVLDRTVSFINAMIKLKATRFFVFVHLKSVLSDDELQSLYEHCALEKVGLLLIESGMERKISEMERATIITDDLCEIVDKNDYK